MTLPGLPAPWGLTVLAIMVAVAVHALRVPRASGERGVWRLSLGGLPLLGGLVRVLTHHPLALSVLRVVLVALFLGIIASGLFGTPLPARNAATVLTWNLWWAGVIVSVLLVGSAWCAVCPWNTLAGWLVKHRLWRRAAPTAGLNLRLPARWRNVMPAFALFVVLTWLELGLGVTLDPFATALLALLMLVLATVFTALFEGSAFCHYMCPVGRTIGFYSQLAPVELRPVNPAICADCTTLECYAGSADVDPCPTHLVMGRLTQNTYCLSCGNCARSCPDSNVAWRLRGPATEAMGDSRPHWDEAWFMIGLLALTGFHGLTMIPAWDEAIKGVARMIGDSRRMLVTFSLVLVLVMGAVLVFYAAMAGLSARWSRGVLKDRFSRFAFVALPLAFAYHVAHNLGHLAREGGGLGQILMNPLGVGTLPLSLAEKQARAMHPLLSPDSVFAVQAVLVVLGFLVAVLIARRRLDPGEGDRLQLLPILGFALAMSCFHLWLLMQPMMMRM